MTETTPLFVRLAGLPATVLESVRSERNATLVEEILDREDGLAAEGAALCDALHETIGSLEDPALRPALVGLRRSVHGRRRPGPRELEAAAAVLPPGTTARLREWRTALTGLATLRASLHDAFDAQLAGSREALREAALHPHVRRGLSATRPELLVRLGPWLRGGGVPSERTLISLARYVARAAVKTSPLSTFTFSGPASWTGSGPAVTLVPTAATAMRVELHRSKVTSIARALARRPEFTASVRLRVNPSARTDGDALTYLAPPPDGSLRTVVLPPGILGRLESLRELTRTRGTLSWHEALAPFSAVPASGGDEGAAKLLTRLADLGVLEVHLPVPDQAPDFLGALLDLTAGVPAADGSADALRSLARVRADLESWTASSDPAERRDLTGAMERDLTEAARACGAGPEELPLTGHPAFETAVHTEPAAECSAEAWASVLDDLDAFRRLLGVFDPGLPFRLGVAAYARRRFGIRKRVPFLTLYGAYYGDLLDGAARTPEADPLGAGALEGLRAFRPVTDALDRMERSPCPRLRALPALRRRASALLAPDDGGHAVRRLDRSEVLALVERWPAFVRPPGSVAVYGQPFVRDGRLRFAVNQVNGGYGRGGSRLARLTGGAEVAARPPARGVCAEVESTLGTSLNLRARATTHAIDYPSLVSERPPDRLIPLGELLVDTGDDDEDLRLHWPRCGGPVELVHTATMSEMLLPPPLRLLMDAFGAAPTPLHSTWRWIREIDASAVPGGTQHAPRVDLGDLTVQRAYWTTSAREVPRQGPGETPAAFLPRLGRWLRDRGIPGRSFVRLMDVSDPTTTSRLMLTKSRKPFYLDTANWFLVRGLVRELERVGDGPVLAFFQEALPGVPDAFATPSPLVSEFLVEITEKEGPA